MAFRKFKTIVLASTIAIGAIMAAAGVAEAHRWCGRHTAAHYGWRKGWHSHGNTYARAYRPSHYGMGRPTSYGYASPQYGAYSTPGYDGYGGYGYGGGLFGSSGLLGMGTGIL